MNIDELKLILTTVQAAGQGAYTLAILWFATEMLKYLVGMGILAASVVLTSRIILHAINLNQFGGKVLAILGSCDKAEYLSFEQTRKFLDQVRRMKEGK